MTRHVVHRISVKEVLNAAEYVVSKLPEFWKDLRTPQIPRVSQEISWIFVDGGTIIDLGGSSGFHASICARLGMRAFCVDNFRVRERANADAHYYDHDLEAEHVASEMGVEFIHVDLLNWKPPFDDNAIDVVMSFDNIEHLHHSPRNLYKEMVRCLRFGGLFLLGAPNAANLFKRVRVPFGRNIFSKMEEWYMYERFIGHVREPVVADFRFIAKDLDLDVMNVFGRNWLGLNRLSNGMQIWGYILSGILVHFPSLCSDIYLLATKSKQSGKRKRIHAEGE